MDEQPEIPAVVSKSQTPLWKRVRAWTVIVLFCAVIVGLAVAGVDLLWHGLRPGVAIDDRILRVVWATGLLFLPAIIARTFLRTRWTTGRWTMSKEAKAQQFSQCLARRKKANPITPYPWLHFAIGWAIYSGSETSFPLWRRMLGWFLIIATVAVLLSVTGLGVIFVIAGLGTFRSWGWAMSAIGLAILLVPTAVVWPLIRHKRATGSWRTLPEELQEIKTEQSVRRDSGRQRPLWTKIISLAMMVAVLAAIWIKDTVHSSPHSRATWTMPAIYTAFGIYAMWSTFRKPKGVGTQDTEPPSATQS